MHSSPLHDDQQLFLRQGLLCRGCESSTHPSLPDQYVNAVARQLVSDCDLFTGAVEKWVQVLLRLSRAASDFLTEENDEVQGQPLMLSSLRRLAGVGSCAVASPTTEEFSPTADALPSFAAALEQGQQCWGTQISSLSTAMNVITVEGSLPDQSLFVDGFMMKKNLAHKVRFMAWRDG